MGEKNNGTIEISIEEYKSLLEMEVRVKVFADYVNREKYNIDRITCASFLGFDLDGKEGDK